MNRVTRLMVLAIALIMVVSLVACTTPTPGSVDKHTDSSGKASTPDKPAEKLKSNFYH